MKVEKCFVFLLSKGGFAPVTVWALSRARGRCGAARLVPRLSLAARAQERKGAAQLPGGRAEALSTNPRQCSGRADSPRHSRKLWCASCTKGSGHRSYRQVPSKSHREVCQRRKRTRDRGVDRAALLPSPQGWKSASGLYWMKPAETLQKSKAVMDWASPDTAGGVGYPLCSSTILGTAHSSRAVPLLCSFQLGVDSKEDPPSRLASRFGRPLLFFFLSHLAVGNDW